MRLIGALRSRISPTLERMFVELMQSVGCVVDTEASQGLGKAERAKSGLPCGVVHWSTSARAYAQRGRQRT